MPRHFKQTAVRAGMPEGTVDEILSEPSNVRSVNPILSCLSQVADSRLTTRLLQLDSRAKRMTFSDLLLLAAVVGLGGWAAYKIPRSMRRDDEWRDALRELARQKDLVEDRAERGPGVHDLDTRITWQWIKDRFSRNPALDSPPAGVPVFTGTNNGFRFVMDSVMVRKYWTSLEDEHIRLAVELPGLPATLRVRPAGRVRRLARAVGVVPRPRDRRGTLTAAFSSNSRDRLEEERFLTAQRLRVLEDLEAKAGEAHVYASDGKLFLIRRRKGASPTEIEALHEHLGAFAERLAGDGESALGARTG